MTLPRGDHPLTVRPLLPLGKTMKPLLKALWLSLLTVSTAATAAPGTLLENHAAHPFDISDLFMLDRLSDPQLSSDGHYAAFSVRSTDYAANKGINAIYAQDLRSSETQPLKVVAKGASSQRWSPDGHSLYYLGPANGIVQLWRLDFRAGQHGIELASGSAPVQVSRSLLDIDSFRLSPNGKAVLLSYAVFADCNDLACTKERLESRVKHKSTGTVYQKLFVRHWDAWADGRRSQLYIAHFSEDGSLPA
jgi:dipeptidyl aminopeptidase/acylaminoacyl peptidase